MKTLSNCEDFIRSLRWVNADLCPSPSSSTDRWASPARSSALLESDPPEIEAAIEHAKLLRLAHRRWTALRAPVARHSQLKPFLGP